MSAAAVESGQALIIQAGGKTWRFTRPGNDAREDGSDQSPGALTAPMPGKIIAVRVKKGETVEKGKLLVVLEAMKMEQPISAPTAGKVAEILCRVGDIVGEGSELLRMDVAEREAS
jgi:3-methylcrotonyl-CoA carboxylase alpha subunit